MAFVTRSGHMIYWEQAGEGSPLLLIQGLGYPSDANLRVLPALTAKHRVIQVDNRGVGRSDVPKDPFSIADMADDAAAVLETAGGWPAHVAGFSMGGLIAQELAVRHPHLVRSLILGCTSPGGDKAVPLSAEVAEQFTEWGNLSARDAAWRAARVCYSHSTRHEEIERDIDVRMKRPTPRPGYLGQLRAVGEYDGVAERINRWSGPVLAVHGSDDLIVPPANLDRITEVIPHADTVVCHKAGHILMTDATDQLTDAMLAFLEQVDASSAKPTTGAQV